MKKGYDVIVVGAGSAGAPLAARLSEDEGRSVLLLEAGPDYRSADTPQELRSANPFGAFFSQPHQWQNLTVRRTPRQPIKSYLRGFGIGGSSSMNAQIAIRGLPEDYNGWGLDDWTFEKVLPSFIGMENDQQFGGDPWHGNEGPIPIYRNPQDAWGPVDRALCEAALDAGYGWCDDHNAPTGSGVSPLAANTRSSGDGLRERVSTNDAYLEPARGRANLTIAGDALVDRILLKGSRAKGVRVRIEGAWQEVEAGTVVVSCGAVASPVILQRSGIGPKARLQELGIEVVADLPAGEGFTDHAMVVLPIALQAHAVGDVSRDRHLNVYVRYSSEAAGRNDMFIASLNATGPLVSIGAIAVGLHQAFSRGQVLISSPDPDVQPVIESRLLSAENDLERLRDGVKRVGELIRHSSLQNVAGLVMAGTSMKPFEEVCTDDAAIDDFLLEAVDDASHAAGTCRMGAPDDPRTVIDGSCRVLGFDNLRVADLSIVPEVPRANTHLTGVMIGEHLAAMMRREA